MLHDCVTTLCFDSSSAYVWSVMSVSGYVSDSADDGVTVATDGCTVRAGCIVDSLVVVCDGVVCETDVGGCSAMFGSADRYMYSAPVGDCVCEPE